MAPSDSWSMVRHFEILWCHNGDGLENFNEVRKWYFMYHSIDNLMLNKIHKKTIAWKSVVFELLQFEDLLNNGILLTQWRESFIFFPSGKKNPYLKSIKKLVLYFSQVSIYIFWKYRQEMSYINWSFNIIKQQFGVFLQDCFTSHLQY